MRMVAILTGVGDGGGDEAIGDGDADNDGHDGTLWLRVMMTRMLGDYADDGGDDGGGCRC